MPDGSPGAFVAYGDTNVFDLGTAMQPMVMVFERAGGRWKLAAAVHQPGGAAGPRCARRASRRLALAVLAAGSYAPTWPGC